MSEEEKPKSEYIGKFVCYDQADGGCCWGRIKDEAEVNTMSGYKEVFILSDRFVRYVRGKNVSRFRRFYPDIANSMMSKPMEMGKDGKLKDGDFFHEVRKVKGDTTLRKEMIDLDKHIIDLSDLLTVMSEDELFKIILTPRIPDNEMAGSVEGIDGETALEIGIQAVLRIGGLSDEVKEVLLKRLQ